MDAAAFIQANLPLAPVPGIPEIRLHQASPTSGLHRLLTDGTPPYWAYRWAGGLALARHILDHPGIVAGRSVLDLGAGSGLVGIASAMAGARHVLAAETDPHAIAALGLNATANDVTITPLHADLLDGAAPPADLILVGDLFYAPDLAGRVTAFLDRCLDAGMTVLVGDPWRAPLPRDRLTLLARYAVAETGGALKDSGVFAFGAVTPAS